MTARRQFRIGGRSAGRDQLPIEANSGPHVGETLQSARERKGVDLYRAERDTKIRLRYLSALEDGAYDELPAPVYVKGFLRNYAIYLGLDPDDVLDRWRDEMEDMRTATRVAVAPPPMPIVEPGGRRVTITPSMIVAVLVGLVVLAFVAYIGIQFLRFVETTPVELTSPANVFSEMHAEQVTLAGTSGPGALISVSGSGNQLYNTTANEDGAWSREVQLARGRNDFTIIATDPVTQRQSKALQVTIVVPLPSASPDPSPSGPPPVLLELSLTSPADGLTSVDPNVVFRGSTNGSRITIASVFLGPPDSSPTPTPIPLGSPEPSPSGPRPPIGPARDVTINALGAFSELLEFEPGRWQVTVAAYASGQTPVARQLTITIGPAAPTSIELVIAVEGRDSWVRVVADGVRVQGYGGRTLRAGETHTVSAINEMCLRSGNLGALRLTLNGQDLGMLGGNGEVGSWILRPNQAPEPAPAPCT